MSFFSQRVSRIQPSPTISITAKTKKLKQEGKKIIDFSAGEPDFDTPDNIKKAAIEAINNGQTKYSTEFLGNINFISEYNCAARVLFGAKIRVGF